MRAYVSTFTGFEPDARRYLVVSLVVGAAISLWWVDFNLYLAAIGIDRATIGLIATAGSLAGVLVAFPASALSDRLGRRTVVAGSIGLMILALLGLLATTATVGILLLAALFGAGEGENEHRQNNSKNCCCFHSLSFFNKNLACNTQAKHQ